jgi:RNA polymerase nonessential primary-like sigma factor
MNRLCNAENVTPKNDRLEPQDFADLPQSLLTAQQRLALISLVKVDDEETRQKVIDHNLSIVVNFARMYGDHGVAILDLIKEGIRGLIHALENFEREGGFRFATYAARCVRLNIERTIMNKNGRFYFTNV